MPRNDESHAARVEAWLEAEAGRLSPPERRRLFEDALTALSRRARRTLGDATLGAIVDRVLFTAIERYPLLAAIEIEGERIRWNGEPPGGELTGEAELEAGRFVLVELFTVLGILTGGILSPSLHAELAGVRRTEVGT